METYAFDYRTANAAYEENPDSVPQFFQVYNTRQDLGIQSFIPQEFDSLIDKMALDAQFFDVFAEYFS